MLTQLKILNSDFSAFWDKLKDIFVNSSIKDYIEIILVTAVLFIGFKFIKGRKAGALLVGIVICLVLVAISKVLEFHSMLYVFESIIGYGPLVIIVLFQPEIRDVFEKLGNGSINGILTFGDKKQKNELYSKVIENICKAVKELSAESTGALIAIERTTGLGDIVHTGIVLNADVNASLLRNIFFNKAPLHDGAVVISDGKIQAASCYLPLTKRTDVDPDLGTRHRAGIGMSEVSDAIIIIVSEETGSISIAYDCSLRRDITTYDLRSFLNETILKINSTTEQ